jgi:biotin transport system substrate-specific component
VFAALIAALGLAGTVSPFGVAVPISLQTLGVMLAGSLLGAKRGALACLVFLALVAAGLPLLSSGTGGLAVFASARGGYLIGWPIGAYVIGWLTERTLPKYRLWLGAVANVVGGVGVVYLFGVPVMAYFTQLRGVALVEAASLFVPGDLIKAAIATAVAYRVHRAYPWLARGVERKDA